MKLPTSRTSNGEPGSGTTGLPLISWMRKKLAVPENPIITVYMNIMLVITLTYNRKYFFEKLTVNQFKADVTNFQLSFCKLEYLIASQFFDLTTCNIRLKYILHKNMLRSYFACFIDKAIAERLKRTLLSDAERDGPCARDTRSPAWDIFRCDLELYRTVSCRLCKHVVTATLEFVTFAVKCCVVWITVRTAYGRTVFILTYPLPASASAKMVNIRNFYKKGIILIYTKLHCNI